MVNDSCVVFFSPNQIYKYYVHINVEFCINSLTIKYILKYISKGEDMYMATIAGQAPLADVFHNCSDVANNKVSQHLHGCYIASPKAL